MTLPPRQLLQHLPEHPDFGRERHVVHRGVNTMTSHPAVTDPTAQMKPSCLNRGTVFRNSVLDAWAARKLAQPWMSWPCLVRETDRESESRRVPGRSFGSIGVLDFRETHRHLKVAPYLWWLSEDEVVSTLGDMEKNRFLFALCQVRVQLSHTVSHTVTQTANSYSHKKKKLKK